MMSFLPVSIVVVSRDRQKDLRLCLSGLSQIQYPAFEIIVVSDSSTLKTLGEFRKNIKTVEIGEANVSAARNKGIAAAGGEIIAFIDDDAVPEPSWLSHLLAPFAQPDVSAVGGFVRGRNGISYQWKARLLQPTGFAQALSVDETQFSIPVPEAGKAVKTEGTNMAVRRDVLQALGGFDEAYHFYLDETDLNMRLLQDGYKTAIAPLAQVHHGYCASERRRVDRVPQDLFDIGASWAVFQRKYIIPSHRDAHWKAVKTSERNRLIEHMVSGGLEPGEVIFLLERLRQGYAAGKQRKSVLMQSCTNRPPAFLPYPYKIRQCAYLSGRPWTAARKRKEAVRMVAEGRIVTLFVFSATALFHTMHFHPDGYWLQRGGIFGKSERTQNLLQFWKRKERVNFEISRINSIRNCTIS